MYVCMHAYIWTYVLAPRGFGDLRRRAIYFQGAGRTGNYFYGVGEQAHGFRDLGSPAKSKK